MKQIVIATGNPGKAKEFEHMFAPLGFAVKTLLDYPEIADIEETGTTFEENAVIKATTAAKLLHLPVIADDSGLAVAALNGEPGVYSARYAGDGKDDAANRHKLLDKMAGLADDERQATFYCVLAVADATGEVLARYSGELDGYITREERGTNGFGYDSIFYVPEFDQTTAEMTADEKAPISHRGRALKLLQADLEKGELML